MWNPSEHSDEENLCWCNLRAIEWGALPAFLSQLFAPVLLIFLSWKPVVAGIIGAQLLWSLVRYKFVSVRFAYTAASIVIMCKWLVAVPSGIYLVLHNQKLAGALALSWPLVVGVLGSSPPLLLGRLQGLFMTQLEYTACANSLDKDSELSQNCGRTCEASISEPCFPIGRYRIDTTIEELQELRPLSRAELIALNPTVEFEAERILHAPPADFMNLSWDTILGTVHSAIYRTKYGDMILIHPKVCSFAAIGMLSPHYLPSIRGSCPRRALALQVFEVDEEFGAFRYFCAFSNTFSSRTISFFACRTSSS